MDKVDRAFNGYDPVSLAKTWLTLCSNLEKIVMQNGGNDYETQHMGKDQIIRQEGRLPDRLRVNDDVVQKLAELAT